MNEIEQIGFKIAELERQYEQAMGQVQVARSRTGGDDTDTERREIRIARVVAMRLQAEIQKLHVLAMCANERGIIKDAAGWHISSRRGIVDALTPTKKSTDDQ